MDPDQGLISAAMAMGSSTPWTLFLVWSRPNWRQSSNAASTLLSVGATPILAGDNNGGSGRLVLFPGTQQTVLTSTLTRRHTHAVILRNTPGTGVDVWLDSTQVATAAPNPMASALSAPLLFLHSGAAAGGAECWFHEAAAWDNALPASAIEAVLSYETRWITGSRKGIQILITGQSNSGNGLNDGAWHLLAQGVAWHLGALGFGVVANYGSPPAATCIHGEGIYPVPALGLSGSFLTNPGDGSYPSTWGLGADGEAVQTWIQANTDAEDAADIAAIFWPWSENDSTRQYQRKGDIRGRGPPSVVARAGHVEPHRRVLAAGLVVGNPIRLRQQRPRGADAAGGRGRHGRRPYPERYRGSAADHGRHAAGDRRQLGAGLQPGHRGLQWRRRISSRSSGQSAATACWPRRWSRAPILASEGGDTITAIPAGVPAAGGPVVTHVYRQTNTSLVVTVQHDCGTDLIVPATLAASGTGWAVMDGGSVAAPGTIVTATACVRLNPTQLQITLAQALVNPSADCRLFYPYGTTTIGRGNAVTDNLSQVTPPAGWNIAADLGAATGVAAAFVSSAAAVEAATPGDVITTPWSFNMPVHIPMSTASGMILSDTQ